MSTTAVYAPVSASALAPGDRVASQMQGVDDAVVVAIEESDETHGPIKHWHVILSDGLAAGEVIAGEDNVFMVRVFLAEDIDIPQDWSIEDI